MNRVLSSTLILSSIGKAPANCECFAKLYHKGWAHSMFHQVSGIPVRLTSLEILRKDRRRHAGRPLPRM